MSGDICQSAVDAVLHRRRRYVVSEHGWPRTGHRRVVRPPASSSTPYTVTTPVEFSLGVFARPENLASAFSELRANGGHAPGEDGLSFHDFSPGELYEALREVSRAIRNGNYKPFPTREVRIPKGDGRFRELRLLRIMDRVVAKALQLALAPYWGRTLPGIRRGIWDIYISLEWTIRCHQRFVLGQDDIRDAFPSARIADVLHYHHQHITQPELLRLIEAVVRGHEGPAHTVGLDQGTPTSPTDMELLLHHCLDLRLEAVDPGHPPLHRYVDNLLYQCRDAQESERVRSLLGETLLPHGLTLKPGDEPVDVRDRSAGRTVLGLIPCWGRNRLQFSVPETGYAKLNIGLLKALDQPNPARASKDVAMGWLRAVGPALSNGSRQVVVSRVRELLLSQGTREASQGELAEVASASWCRWLEKRGRRLGGTTG